MIIDKNSGFVDVLKAVNSKTVTHILCKGGQLLASGDLDGLLDRLDGLLAEYTDSATDDPSDFELSNIDGTISGVVPGKYHGVILADASVGLALYPTDGAGRADTTDDPIWETYHDARRCRVLRTDRRPLVVEQTGHELFDDLAVQGFAEWQSYAAENGYKHARRDIYTKAGREYVLTIDEPTPDNCMSDVIII